jgi:hypothetical protein
MTPVLSTATIAEQPGACRGPDFHRGNPLNTIAAMSSCEQDRLLVEHSEVVADHMANHFSRRSPHLAASSGIALWQRAAGVAAALGAMALLVIAPLILWIVLTAAITAITLAQVVIAIASRWRRPGAGAPSRAPAVPDAGLPSYTILVRRTRNWPELHHPPVRAGILPALRAHPARPGPSRAADPARRNQ